MKLLHTADWQLGLRLNFIGGDAAARLRTQRFETVRAIAELARVHRVDAVLVAGDVFDDNGVGADTIQQARDSLRTFAGIPVILLPGNHDPATPDSALVRLGELPGDVYVAREPGVISLDAGDVYTCPLTARHTYDDPSDWLPAHEGRDRVRIVLAHGGVLSFGELADAPNRIDVDRIVERGYDYVALGDYHGTLEVNERAWYSGTHEATRFKEKAPGNVLIVEVPEPGAAPAVETVAVARSHWQSKELQLDDDTSLEALLTQLDAIGEKSWTLLELTLAGQLSLAGRHRLEQILDDYRLRLAFLRVDDDAVRDAPTEADLAALHGEGYLGRAIDALRTSDNPVDADALRLLYRLVQEFAP
jgi:DNA repair exonuclease SbcCD nuclease subunit